jgi:N-methylhydantoinase A
MILLGIDTGGTFTDFIYRKDGTWGIFKTLSTPHNPALAVMEGIDHIAAGETVEVVHGSTVATNALLERKGACTALVTNAGFEDVLEIGRQNRSALYRLSSQKTPPLVPRDRRFGIDCRVGATGDITRSLGQSELEDLVQTVSQSGADAVAVCLLYAFKNPRHEIRVKKALSKLGLPVSLSHEILSEFREFERTATTACNAYVLPKMKHYLERLEASENIRRLRIMQSNGGSILARTAGREPVRTILSGPAGGVVGALELGKQAGFGKLITFDMGGTSTDVSLIDEGLPLTTEAVIAGLPLKVPAIDIHTVGAGGGSIAEIDAGGSLRVGPESAGAAPGPICYGKGEKITVTDANLFLGRLLPDRFLGGRMTLDRQRMDSAFRSLSKQLGLTDIELAEGILAVANAGMERAVRVISVQRGFDPGEFALFSFGGAGGLHAADLARMLGIPRVLVPRHPGILSAMGMLLSDIILDDSLTVMLPGDTRQNHIKSLLEPLESRGRSALLKEGVAPGDITLEPFLDMRYRGQSFELMVPFGEDHIGRFHDLHEKTYGFSESRRAVEIVNLRLRARGRSDKPDFPKLPRGGSAPPAAAGIGRTPICFDGTWQEARVLDREKLQAGNRFQGPALLTEYSSTIIVPPFAEGRVDGMGNVIIEVVK